MVDIEILKWYHIEAHRLNGCEIESLKTIYDEERVELQTSNSFIRRMSKKD